MKLKDVILNDMPDNIDEIEKARYIYLKLALYVNFSTKYQNTSLDEMSKMYKDMSMSDLLEMENFG